MKTKTITLAGPTEVLDRERPGHTISSWKVIKVTDSIEFHPGEWLQRAKVDELCEAKCWKVTVVAEAK